MMKSWWVVMVFPLVLFACQSGSEEIDEASVPNAPQIEIVVNSGDNMKFDVKTIVVRQGQEVILTLNHLGKASIKTMGHNFVLLEKGVSIGKFAQKASKAKDNDYIPVDHENEVVAYTRMIGGGESDVITFQSPERGEYDFICSFPGHSSIMRGRLIVI